MNEILDIAEAEMIDLKHPYVGTEHFFLAYLKRNPNLEINYNEFKEALIKYIGRSNIISEYILYTPLLRKYVASLYTEKEVVEKILVDDNSIAFNMLKIMGVNINNVLKNL